MKWQRKCQEESSRRKPPRHLLPLRSIKLLVQNTNQHRVQTHERFVGLQNPPGIGCQLNPIVEVVPSIVDAVTRMKLGSEEEGSTELEHIPPLTETQIMLLVMEMVV